MNSYSQKYYVTFRLHVLHFHTISSSLAAANPDFAASHSGINIELRLPRKETSIERHPTWEDTSGTVGCCGEAHWASVEKPNSTIGGMRSLCLQ